MATVDLLLCFGHVWLCRIFQTYATFLMMVLHGYEFPSSEYVKSGLGIGLRSNVDLSWCHPPLIGVNYWYGWRYKCSNSPLFLIIMAADAADDVTGAVDRLDIGSPICSSPWLIHPLLRHLTSQPPPLRHSSSPEVKLMLCTLPLNSRMHLDYFKKSKTNIMKCCLLTKYVGGKEYFSSHNAKTYLPCPCFFITAYRLHSSWVGQIILSRRGVTLPPVIS